MSEPETDWDEVERRAKRQDRLDTFFGFLVIALLVLLIGAVIVLGVRQIARHAAGTRCDGFEHDNGWTTQVADYSFWQWECVALTTDGRWLPVDQLRGTTAT